MRYGQAAALYRDILKADPQCAPAYDGLVRALIEGHRAAEAYMVADAAMQQAPKTAGSLAANGRALLRKGKIAQAERTWLAAVAIDPKNASAVAGLAEINRLVARFQTASVYTAMAHRLSPEDPELLAAYAAGLHGAERLAFLRTALGALDPESQRARSLRAYVTAEEARGERKFNVLASAYRAYSFKMLELRNGPKGFRGYGLRVSFNGHGAATLLLDTGASGIALAPRLAEKFGLEQLGGEGALVGGIGDKAERNMFRYAAASVKVGDLELGNVPVAVFDTAKSPDFDGLIGGNVFAKFLVTVDFPNGNLELAPFARESAPADGNAGPRNAEPLPAGLSRMYRRGHMLLAPTLVNDATEERLFLIDSGSFSNLIDTAVARETGKTRRDAFTTVQGIQGKVKDVSRADVVLQFARLRQKNPELLAVDLTKMSDGAGLEVAGIIGMPVLLNLKVTIDYRDNGISLEYKPK